MIAEPPAVEVKNFVKKFKSQAKKQDFVAVDGVSLKIMPGEVYGLIGPNGSGKSTTMKAVLGLVEPTAGTCHVFGHNSLHVDSRKDIGFLPENPYFYKHLTGQETLRFYGKLCGMKGKALSSAVDEMLEMVSLQDARHRRLGGYSKGMLQRIGIAQALIHKPKLVILDEPTAGVDPVGSREIRDMIMRLRDEGITIFLCSHLLEQVQEVCDQVGIIFEGKMVTQGPLEKLIAIEDQTQVILEDADPELLVEIENLVKQYGESKLLSMGKPSTTLERMFIEIAKSKTAQKKQNLAKDV